MTRWSAPWVKDFIGMLAGLESRASDNQLIQHHITSTTMSNGNTNLMWSWCIVSTVCSVYVPRFLRETGDTQRVFVGANRSKEWIHLNSDIIWPLGFFWLCESDWLSFKGFWTDIHSGILATPRRVPSRVWWQMTCSKMQQKLACHSYLDRRRKLTELNDNAVYSHTSVHIKYKFDRLQLLRGNISKWANTKKNAGRHHTLRNPLGCSNCGTSLVNVQSDKAERQNTRDLNLFFPNM